MRWDDASGYWHSLMTSRLELPEELRQVFRTTGYGCFAAETSLGVIHVCHASEEDIAGFSGKPVSGRWQLVRMPTAPLIRLELAIHDRPGDPYRFESFLNAADEEQTHVLAQLANQKQLHLAFYGEDLSYRASSFLPHSEQQWQQLDGIVAEVTRYWDQLPSERRDFDRAKAEYVRRFP